VNLAANVETQIAACRANPGTGNSNCNAGFVDVYGNIAAPARTPKFTWTAFATYKLETQSVTIKPTAGFTRQSEMAISTSGSKAAGSHPDARVNNTWIGSQIRVNGSIEFSLPTNPGWALTVECRNCFDKVYPVSYLAPTTFIDSPGLWNVRITRRF
jgi:hypothetical protein